MHRYCFLCRSRENGLWIVWLESLTIFTPHDIEFLDGRMYWAVRTTVCSAMRMRATPSSDAVNQDALRGTAVELFEDLRAHTKPFQPTEGEAALSCFLHNCVCVCGTFEVLSDLDTEEPEALDLLHCSPVDVDGLTPMLGIVHD
jgi:hypothetical protein